MGFRVVEGTWLLRVYIREGMGWDVVWSLVGLLGKALLCYIFIGVWV